jgi:uncharacterized protein YbjQ (UPF0145 family)
MLVVTTNDLPGWEIQRVCGEVMGLTVRSRNAFSQMGAGFKSLVGGELRGMTQNLANSRIEVMNRMIEEARKRGGNAIVAMRFDTSQMSNTWTEICAYGTAVVAVPVTDAARETARELGYADRGASRARPRGRSAATDGHLGGGGGERARQREHREDQHHRYGEADPQRARAEDAGHH